VASQQFLQLVAVEAATLCMPVVTADLVAEPVVSMLSRVLQTPSEPERLVKATTVEVGEAQTVQVQQRSGALVVAAVRMP